MVVSNGVLVLCCHRAAGCLLLVLIRIRTEQHIEESEKNNNSCCCADSEGTAFHKKSELVEHQCYTVSEYVLEDDCKPEPLSGLHLLGHC